MEVLFGKVIEEGVLAEIAGLKFYGLVEELRNELHKKVDVFDMHQLKGNI